MQNVVRRWAVLLVLAVGLGLALPQVTPAQAKKDTVKVKDKKETPTKGMATFELYKDSGGKYRYRLRDGDGTIVAIASRGYPTKAACQKAIDAIRRDAARAQLKDMVK